MLLNIVSPSNLHFIFVNVTVYQRFVDFKKTEVWVPAQKIQRTHKTTSKHGSRTVPGALRTVFYRSNTGIAFSNLSRNRDECSFSVFMSSDRNRRSRGATACLQTIFTSLENRINLRRTGHLRHRTNESS